MQVPGSASGAGTLLQCCAAFLPFPAEEGAPGVRFGHAAREGHQRADARGMGASWRHAAAGYRPERTRPGDVRSGHRRAAPHRQHRDLRLRRRALAYAPGLRHSFDADRMAAIGNTTCKLVNDGKRAAERRVLLLAGTPSGPSRPVTPRQSSPAPPGPPSPGSQQRSSCDYTELPYPPGHMAREATAGLADPGREAVEDVLALLRSQGGRATPARRLLLDALFASTGHRSAEELAAGVRAVAPTSTCRRSTATCKNWNGSASSTAPGSGPARPLTTSPPPRTGTLSASNAAP